MNQPSGPRLNLNDIVRLLRTSNDPGSTSSPTPASDKGPSIQLQKDIHRSLWRLFPNATSPADLRHFAWGALVYELCRTATVPLDQLTKDHEQIFRGIRPDGKPATLGWYQLQKFPSKRKKADGEGVKRGKIIRFFDDLVRAGDEGARVAELGLLALAGLAEPRVLLGWVADDDGGPVSLSLAAERLRERLFENRDEQGGPLSRALALYTFVCAKTVYDEARFEKPPEPERFTLFDRIHREVSRPEAVEPPKAITTCVPILDTLGKGVKPSTIVLWEQYSHLVLSRRELPAHEPSLATKKRPSTGGDAELPAPPLSDQVAALERHVGSWATTGVARGEDFIDTNVMAVRCLLPDVDTRWESLNLRHFAAQLAEAVTGPGTVSHLVCLVGPYGTGKTTTAQRLFQAMHEAEPNRWLALTYDPVEELIRPEPLWGSDAATRFKQCDLSRVLLELGAQTSMWLGMRDVPPGSRIVINASEMNALDVASEEKGGRKGLEAIEVLLRELGEKYAPSEIVVFVALQAASMSSELEKFFRERPDLAHGRARLDELWLVRGDCVQLELQGEGEGDDDDPLVDLLRRRLPGLPTLTNILARRLYTPIHQKSSLLRRQLDRSDTSGAPRALVAFAKMVTGDAKAGDTGKRVASPLDRPIDEWVPEASHRSLGQAFRLGVGTLASSQIALWNGFQRQFWDMVRNESELLLWELGPNPAERGRDGSKDVENLCRMLWLETLGEVSKAELGSKSKSFGVRVEPFEAGESGNNDLFSPGKKKCTVTTSHSSGHDTNNFDLALWVTVTKKGSESIPFVVGVDVVRKIPQGTTSHLSRKVEPKGCRIFEIDAVACTFDPVEPGSSPSSKSTSGISPRRGHRQLTLSKVPMFITALAARIGFDSNWAKPRHMPVAFDVWIEDHGEADPTSWTVSKMFCALDCTDATKDVHKILQGSLGELRERAQQGVPPWLEDLEEGLVMPPTEARELVWRFERRFGQHLGVPLDATDDEADETSGVKLPDNVVFRPAVDGRISLRRKVPYLRGYLMGGASPAATTETTEPRKLLVACVAWRADEKGEIDDFRPRHVSLAWDKQDGGKRLMNKTDPLFALVSEVVLREASPSASSAPEEGTPSDVGAASDSTGIPAHAVLALVGRVTNHQGKRGDEVRCVFFVPVSKGDAKGTTRGDAVAGEGG